MRSLELPIPDEWADEWRSRDEEGHDGRDGTIGEEAATAGSPTPSTIERPQSSPGQAEDNGDAPLPEGLPGTRGTADNPAARTRPGDSQTADTIAPPEGVHHSYWTEVPRFQRMWARHETDWPEDERPAAKVDRSADPPGSWRTDSNLFLSPEKHDQTKDAISEVHDAEPRVTADVERVGQESRFSPAVEGLDFRRKGEERLKEKIAEVIRDNPDAPPIEVVQAIPDAIRYTFSVPKESYTESYWEIKELLESCGHVMYQSNNSWENPEYKGINTRWMTPEGQRFEVQFHTLESYHAKQEITHSAYERIRNPLTSKAELKALKEFQQEVSSWIPVPQGATNIPSFRR